ncbi:hypothetical protein [Lentzea sp. E54]|uniref:hypothetical protein n=1 Tax=Lentzea xerophila TaxID=3435883 RepID=UPI003DA381BF
MRMRTLGRTGIQVSPYCLGTMLSGQNGNPGRALDAGINFVDVYGPHGLPEEIVGAALRGRRADVVPSTKVNGPMGDGRRASGGLTR